VQQRTNSIKLIALSPILDPLFVVLVPVSFGTSLYGLTLKFQALGDIFSANDYISRVKRFDIGQVGEAYVEGSKGEVVADGDLTALKYRIKAAAELASDTALPCPSDPIGVLKAERLEAGAPKNM
jgi:hypothetical protein